MKGTQSLALQKSTLRGLLLNILAAPPLIGALEGQGHGHAADGVRDLTGMMRAITPEWTPVALTGGLHEVPGLETSYFLALHARRCMALMPMNELFQATPALSMQALETFTLLTLATESMRTKLGTVSPTAN